MQYQSILKKEKVLKFTVLVVVIFGGGLAAAFGQSTVGGKSLVTVPFVVSYKDERKGAALEKEHFKLIENGIAQDVAFFAPSNTPLNVLILVDRTESMTKQLPQIDAAIEAFLKQLRPDDQVAIASFAGSVDEVVKLSKVSDINGKGVDLRGNGFPICVYDAVDYGLKLMSGLPGRKAILLLTEGISIDGKASAAKNLREAIESDAMIYTVRFGGPKPPPVRVSSDSVPPAVYSGDSTGGYSNADNGRKAKSAKDSNRSPGYSQRDTDDMNRQIETYMQDLSSLTGGRSFKQQQVKGIGQIFEDIAGDMSKQYSLGYYSNTAGGNGEHRKIAIETDVPNAAIRSRNEIVYRKAVN